MSAALEHILLYLPTKSPSKMHDKSLSEGARTSEEREASRSGDHGRFQRGTAKELGNIEAKRDTKPEKALSKGIDDADFEGVGTAPDEAHVKAHDAVQKEPNAASTRGRPTKKRLNETPVLEGQRFLDGKRQLELRLADGRSLCMWEVEIHEIMPRVLYELWRTNDREVNPQGQQFYEPFKILSYRKGTNEVLVQWVGFRPDKQNTTWEPRENIIAAAPGLWEDFQARKIQAKGQLKRGLKILNGRVTKPPGRGTRIQPKRKAARQ